MRVTSSLMLVLSMTVGPAGCGRGSNYVSSAGEFQPDKDTVLECKLEIKQDDSGIFATVDFTNPTNHSEHVLKAVLLDEEPLIGPPFIITKDGKGVPTRNGWCKGHRQR